MYKFKESKYKWVLKMTQKEAIAYLGTGWSLPQKNAIFPVENKAEITLYLPIKDAFSLRLKMKTDGITNFQELRVFLNKHRIFIFYKKKIDKEIKLYFKISRNYVYKGENKLEFVFPEDWVERIGIYSIKLRNYLGFNSHFPEGAILFDDSLFVKSYQFFNWKTFLGILLLFWVIYLFSRWGASFISDLTKIDFDSVYRKGLFSFLSSVVIFVPIFLLSILTPYHFVIGKFSFVFIILGASLIFWGILLLIDIILSRISSERLKLLKFSNYLKSSKLCIVGFTIFLILCAFLLVFRLEKIANELANIAYFLLVIGVGIEFYNLLRYKDENKRDA